MRGDRGHIAQYDVIYFIDMANLRGTRNVDGPKALRMSGQDISGQQNQTGPGLGVLCFFFSASLSAAVLGQSAASFSLPCLYSAACSPERTSRCPPRGATTAPTVSTALSSQTTTQACLRHPPRPMSRPTGQCPRTQMQATFSIQTRHAKITPTGHLWLPRQPPSTSSNGGSRLRLPFGRKKSATAQLNPSEIDPPRKSFQTSPRPQQDRSSTDTDGAELRRLRPTALQVGYIRRVR